MISLVTAATPVFRNVLQMFIFEKQLFPNVSFQKKIEAADFLRFGKNLCKLLKAINIFNNNKKK